jgi:hypothetical protein
MSDRKAFEAWYRSKYRLVYLVWMDEFGEYESESEETAWQAWNQALELAAAKSNAAEYRRTIENEAIDKCCDAAHDAIHQAIVEVDQCEDVKAAVNSALESLKG